MVSCRFITKLRERWAEGKFVCVGLDTDPDKLPNHPHCSQMYELSERMASFNRGTIDTTHTLVCGYKLNLAFYLGAGLDGLIALQSTIQYIQRFAPGVAIILDCKWADIDNTNLGYLKYALGLGVDAITVHPTLGQEALLPLLASELGIIVLCRTSNKGSGEFQDLKLENGERLYKQVAMNVSTVWNKRGNCALVVGATQPDELSLVRAIAPDLPILIPGVGKQGGSLKEAVLRGIDRHKGGIIINSSRDVIYASSEANFAEAARSKVELMNAEIREHLH